jgi:arginyl-tRNA synthetase
MTDKEVSFQLTTPENSEHGDYSTNAALVLSKLLGKPPREIAERIALKIGNLSGKARSRFAGKLEILDKVELAGPGFVNFFVSKDALTGNLNTILQQQDSFGKSDRLAGKKVMTEFTDPNPFKEFHIGHLYSNTVGEAISRLIESQGAEIRRVTYQGDIGLHVAKAMYGIMKKSLDYSSSERSESRSTDENSSQLARTIMVLDDLDKKSLSERAKFLGEAYALGATAYEESEEAKQEIIVINKKIFAHDEQIMPMYEKGKQWSLEYFESIYRRLGSRFDRLFMESEVADAGKKLVLGYLEKGVFQESEGAVVFPGKEYGLHTRVFINSLGLPTYEAKELGLAPAKYEYFPFDLSVMITGNEITEYFKVLMKALSFIRPELVEKTVHIGHGMVRLPEGKMSSRTGNVITGEWLLDEAKRRAEEKIQEAGIRKQEIENESDVAEKVGVAAVKYALLKNGIGGDIAFSFDESVSFEGNAGPYLQYTYVRTQSVLNKRKVQSSKLKTNWKMENEEWKLNDEELSLLRHLLHFPEVVEYASLTYAPNALCEYLYQLAQKFNLFYAKHKVVGSEQEQFRLSLVAAVGQTIKNGLTILGIPTVEKM